MGELATHVPGRGRSGPRWLFLLRPGWIAWHLFAIGATWGMIWLADWQLHRALSGNSLSWAYTFEWPLFTIFGWYFWFRTVRDEFRRRAGTLPAFKPAAEQPESAQSFAEASSDAPAASTGSDYLAKLAAEVRSTHRKR
jgi:hypothetical protein